MKQGKVVFWEYRMLSEVFPYNMPVRIALKTVWGITTEGMEHYGSREE